MGNIPQRTPLLGPKDNIVLSAVEEVEYSSWNEKIIFNIF